MPGFEFRYRLSGNPPTFKDLALTDVELLSRGDMLAMTDAKVGLGRGRCYEERAGPFLRVQADGESLPFADESFDVTYTLFTPRGVPIRAQATTTLKEYRPVDIQVKETPKTSPTVEKAYTARGESLSEVAGQVYRDPTLWRVIARANGIRDPRRLEPGRVLTIPALR